MDTPEALQEFLQYTIGNLILHPKDAVIAHEHKGNKHFYNVLLNPEDIGRVIGKNGYTISAIRSLLTAAARRDGLSVSLKVSQKGDDVVLPTDEKMDADPVPVPPGPEPSSATETNPPL